MMPIQRANLPHRIYANLAYSVMGVSRGKMPLESNGVGINSRRLPAESVVSAFQHITYTTAYSKQGFEADMHIT